MTITTQTNTVAQAEDDTLTISKMKTMMEEIKKLAEQYPTPTLLPAFRDPLSKMTTAPMPEEKDDWLTPKLFGWQRNALNLVVAPGVRSGMALDMQVLKSRRWGKSADLLIIDEFADFKLTGNEFRRITDDLITTKIYNRCLVLKDENYPDCTTEVFEDELDKRDPRNASRHSRRKIWIVKQNGKRIGPEFMSKGKAETFAKGQFKKAVGVIYKALRDKAERLELMQETLYGRF